MLLRSLKLKRVLSFGPEAEPVELRPFNLLIGPNGSGKSNFIEAIGLLQAAPGELARPIRDGGGIRSWLWRSGGAPVSYTDVPVPAELEAVLINNEGHADLRHRLAFTEVDQRFAVVDERIELAQPRPGAKKPYFFFGYEDGSPMLNTGKRSKRSLQRQDIDPQRSILAQRKDPDQYPELSFVSDAYEGIRLYREWSFGPGAAPRHPQPADLPTSYLLPDARNLGLVLNRLRRDVDTKRQLVEALQQCFAGITDFSVQVEGGTVQIFLEEQHVVVPATRLSDGTMRWLALIALLVDPRPPRLIVIEEPELGLHPDLIRTLASLLRQAAQRTQLVVTTHSTALLDMFSDDPEAVLVCERAGDSTTMRRLDGDALAGWLERYSLGELWSKGELGGVRW